MQPVPVRSVSVAGTYGPAMGATRDGGWDVWPGWHRVRTDEEIRVENPKLRERQVLRIDCEPKETVLSLTGFIDGETMNRVFLHSGIDKLLPSMQRHSYVHNHQAFDAALHNLKQQHLVDARVFGAVELKRGCGSCHELERRRMSQRGRNGS